MNLRLNKPQKRFLTALIFLTLSGLCFADDSTGLVSFEGIWVINAGESDDTDKQVEKAIKAAGGKIRRTGKKGKGRYRGGPVEQELYDHISYDDILQIHYSDPEFQFVYPEGFKRVFYTDNRSRIISARGNSEDSRQDYSFAGWEGDKLLVESRPRDGGWINETYSLEAAGQRLRVELQLKPSSFLLPIEIVRIFNRYEQQAPE